MINKKAYDSMKRSLPFGTKLKYQLAFIRAYKKHTK